MNPLMLSKKARTQNVYTYVSFYILYKAQKQHNQNRTLKVRTMTFQAKPGVGLETGMRDVFGVLVIS